MMNKIYSQYTATVTELKKSPNSILKGSNGKAVAVLTNNEPTFYVVDAVEYQEMKMSLEAFQRSAVEIESVPSVFKASKESLSRSSAFVVDKLLNDTAGHFVECV
jgi:antitoxin StbD